MVLNILWFLLFAIMVSFADAHEYVYPVACHNDSIFVLYQKNRLHIELFQWFYRDGIINPVLLSRYTPAGFSMLPSGNGFSFVDNGVLLVKQFDKRSPHTVAFDTPITHVEMVYWIDDTHCYTSAIYRNYSIIVEIDYDGGVTPLLMCDEADCRYPQKIGSSLYYIEYDQKNGFRIMRAPYSTERISTNKECCELINNGQQPLSFLTMINDDLGYCIGYPLQMYKDDVTIPFVYYECSLKENTWSLNPLFTFSIPTPLLHTKNMQRVYESLLPLRPVHIRDTIYYVDEQDGKLAIYAWDTATKQKKLCISQESHVFGIVPYKKGFFYGGSLRGALFEDDDFVLPYYS